jgi:tRNA (Thr-GGU) A37 N-methylase
MEIILKPVATIKNSRKTPTDDFWGEVVSEIEFYDQIPLKALEGISDFSH